MFSYFIGKRLNVQAAPDLIFETLKSLQSNADTLYYLSELKNNGLNLKKSYLNAMPLPDSVTINRFMLVHEYIKNNSD